MRPFCSALHGTVGASVVIQGRNNDIIVKTFPLLNYYARAIVENDDSSAYFNARKLDALDRQLKWNIAQLHAMLPPDPMPSASRSPQPDARLRELRNQLNAVIDAQQRVERSLGSFVNAALYNDLAEARAS